MTARGELASAVGIRNAGRWLSLLHAGLQSSRSSGRVTAGIACGSKLKRDGWRVVDLSPFLGGRTTPSFNSDHSLGGGASLFFTLRSVALMLVPKERILLTGVREVSSYRLRGIRLQCLTSFYNTISFTRDRCISRLRLL